MEVVAMGQKQWLHFDDASISNIQDLNSSFATGRLRVMYTGENQNGSEFSQDVVEAALPSLPYVPIVAHYDIDANEIGSHDVEVVKDGDGLRLRNLTEPCGVVPSDVNARFEEEADENGVTHNYLVIEPVILWKRQEVYNHIVNDLGGRVSHSMEVNISSFHKDKDDPMLKVDAFEFEALCLLERARPCFEGSALEVFSADDGFKAKMELLMNELREAFSKVNTPDEEIDIDKTQINMEGGRVLDEKLALLEEYGLNAETLDFSLDDFSLEELREKFEAMKGANAEPDADANATFELSSNLQKVLADAFNEKTVERPWGPERVYWFEDYDQEAGMAYAQDLRDWNVYGFPFSMNGDAAVIDFESGKRMKRAFVEFDEGVVENADVVPVFEAIGEKFAEQDKAWAEKYEALEVEFNALKESTADYEELKNFKANAEQEQENAEREEVFERFEDLAGNEAFEALRENSEGLSTDALEKECYAIRGMLVQPTKFEAHEKTPKLRVVKTEIGAKNEPYGGLFREFGPHRHD